MTIKTDELVPYMLIFAGVVSGIFAIYSVRTGESAAWVIKISRRDQPLMFRLAVWILVVMTTACFVVAILSLLKMLT